MIVIVIVIGWMIVIVIGLIFMIANNWFCQGGIFMFWNWGEVGLDMVRIEKKEKRISEGFVKKGIACVVVMIWEK